MRSHTRHRWAAAWTVSHRGSELPTVTVEGWCWASSWVAVVMVGLHLAPSIGALPRDTSGRHGSVFMRGVRPGLERIGAHIAFALNRQWFCETPLARMESGDASRVQATATVTMPRGSLAGEMGVYVGRAPGS